MASRPPDLIKSLLQVFSKVTKKGQFLTSLTLSQVYCRPTHKEPFSRYNNIHHFFGAPHFFANIAQEITHTHVILFCRIDTKISNKLPNWGGGSNSDCPETLLLQEKM